MNATMNTKILSIGEIIWDVYPDRQVIGGAPLNFAAHCSLCGAQSALFSAVGSDALAHQALTALSDLAICTQYVKTAPYPTGQCIVTLDENAVPSYNVLREVAYDYLTVTDGDLASINAAGYDALYFGTLIQRNGTSRNAVRKIVENCSFREILCDLNLRPNCYDADSADFCLRHATVLKVSAEEEPILRAFGLYTPTDNTPQNIARALCQRYPNVKLLLITLGKDGSYAYDARSRKDYTQHVIGNTVVSTVGAGDSFAAAWLTSFLSGRSLEECMKKAAEISGFVVAHTEAVPRY